MSTTETNVGRRYWWEQQENTLRRVLAFPSHLSPSPFLFLLLLHEGEGGSRLRDRYPCQAYSCRRRTLQSGPQMVQWGRNNHSLKETLSRSKNTYHCCLISMLWPLYTSAVVVTDFRWQNLPREDRNCTKCNSSVVGDELRFLSEGPAYKTCS